MEASKMSLFDEFIQGAYGSQYVIPVYQRKYTWRKDEQVKQLLNDIETILNGKAERHFIGSIVYNIVKTDFTVKEREVVDGQQRLITMFLIAYALRDIAKSRIVYDDNGEAVESEDRINYKDVYDTMTNNYLENGSQKKYKYRLKPSVSDDDAYSYITEDDVDSYHGKSLLMDNYLYIKDYFNDMLSQYSFNEVYNAVRSIYIVRIELGADDDAQQIFESINSTGEILTSADLIRNYVLMRRKSDDQERIYKKYWQKLEEIFPESKKLAEFFRLYLAAKTTILTTEKDLYLDFKRYWVDNGGVNSYATILEDVINYANHYSRLYLEKGPDKLGSALDDFRTMQSNMPAPFAMKMLEHLRVGDITDKQVTSVLQVLVIYLTRRYLCSLKTSSLTRMFPVILRNVEEQLAQEKSFKNFEQICIYYLINDNRAKTAFMPDDKQLMDFLSTANAYKLTKIIRFVLDKIETNNNPAPVDLSKLNIEHIMPQTPNDYWDSIANLSQEEYIQKVNLLGNLTLAAVSDNSKMGNDDFDAKKKILQNTGHLKLNENILNKSQWLVSDIDSRTQTLIKKIIAVFPDKTTKYSIAGKDSNRNITLSLRGIHATGYLNEDGSLVVYPGSKVRYSIPPQGDFLINLRNELLENGIILERSGVYIFKQNCKFTSPTAAANFILGGSNNGWECWRDKDNRIIGDSLRYIK